MLRSVYTRILGFGKEVNAVILNDELLSVSRGEQGEAMRKVLNTLVMYGEAFGAERMVKITGEMGHAVSGPAP